MILIIGNAIALIASLLKVCSGIVKSKKKILCFEMAKCGLAVISNIVLGGITGAIINAVGCIRSILCYKEKLRLKEKILITIILIVLCLKFNNIGLIGLLPLVSTIVYTWKMNVKDSVKFKSLVVFTTILWFFYDMSIKSYTAAFFEFSAIILNCVSIIEIKSVGKNKEINYI